MATILRNDDGVKHGGILSNPKDTIVILRRVRKTALTAPRKGLPY